MGRSEIDNTLRVPLVMADVDAAPGSAGPEGVHLSRPVRVFLSHLRLLSRSREGLREGGETIAITGAASGGLAADADVAAAGRVGGEEGVSNTEGAGTVDEAGVGIVGEGGGGIGGVGVGGMGGGVGGITDDQAARCAYILKVAAGPYTSPLFSST